MADKERPPYWLPVEHSMLRRSLLNNYHVGHKAYMVTLKIEDMAPLLSELAPAAIETTSAQPAALSPSSAWPASG